MNEFDYALYSSAIVEALDAAGFDDRAPSHDTGAAEDTGTAETDAA